MKKAHFALLALLTGFVVTTTCLYFKKPEGDAVLYIESKVTQKDVSPGLYPVLIFRTTEMEQGKPMKIESFGSGTAFVGRSGEWKVTTAGHIFYKGYKNFFYVFRRLRPRENSAQMGAVSAVPIGEDDFDVAECSVGEPKKIDGFSSIGGEVEKNRDMTWNYRPIKEMNITGIKNLVLTSLVSGEKAKIYAASSKKYGNGFHWIIGYRSIKGESGSGFVDENGWLYVLSGEVTTGDYQKLEVPENDKFLSIVTGPFEVLKKP